MRPLGSRLSLIFGLSVVVILYVISARWHVLHSALNTDEGFYAIATRSVAEGDVPYRDFGFTQPPVVLYANALPLRVIGFGLFAQRTLNGLWAAAALALGAVWLGRRTRPEWALALVLLFGVSLPWMHFIHLGKTYGFTTLLVTLAALAYLALAAGPRRLFLLGLLGALGLATRLPAAPFFAMLWVLALFPGRRPEKRELLAAFAGGLVGLAVGVLPFFIADAEALKFWTLDFHRLSLPVRTWHLSFTEIVTLAPAAWLLAAVALGFAVARSRWRTREVGVLVAALVTLAANLLPSGVYEEYGVPFLLPLVLAAAAVLYDLLPAGLLALATLCTAVVAVQFLTAPLLVTEVRPGLSRFLPPHARPYDLALADDLAGARQVVESTLPPNEPFIGPHLILAAETSRAVPRELRMGSFSFTAELSSERATRLHLVTRAQLDDWFYRRDPHLLAFFKRWDLDYGWSMPSFTDVPDDARARELDALQRRYALAYQNGDFLLLTTRPNSLR